MGKTVELHFATKDKYVHHIFTHRLIKKSSKNSTAIKSYEGNKNRSREELTETSLVVVVTWSATTPVVVGSSPGGIGCFFRENFF